MWFQYYFQWGFYQRFSNLYIIPIDLYSTLDLSRSIWIYSTVEVLPFPEWCEEMATHHPQFFYWNKSLQLEILFLQFLRSQRDANFLLYVETLRKIIPWMFAMDHYHYSRWLSIHVRDLMQLHNRCPSAYAEFMAGHFVTQKSSHKFSSLAHDQIHEQLNAMVKGDGGVIGITENDQAL